MNRIIDYQTVFGDDSSELHDGVRELIAKGWQPLGGLCYFTGREDSNAEWWCKLGQAMVRYEEEAQGATT